MKISEITDYLESLAPISSQESYDNSGLIVGNKSTEITKALVCLDCIESIIDEAIAKNCNLIIAHHPIVFKGLKKLNGKNYVERTLLKAIKNDIAIYAIHTNLDNYKLGVNKKIGDVLGIKNTTILSPKGNVLNKISVYVPTNEVEQVREAAFAAGAGNIANYTECSFGTEGVGTFKGNEASNPVYGEKGKRSSEAETKLEFLVSKHSSHQVVRSIINAHPYEEVAYDIYALENENQDEGSGMIGELDSPINETDFLQMVKDKFNCGTIRHTALQNKPIERVAWCGGSGSFLLNVAKSKKADIFITADFKYHEFFDAENQLIIADIGHFESEQFTIDLIADFITKKFPTFALCLTENNTNPVKYF
ncbi:MAG: Nif3-like dinuclear metal center hexameric protein [Crocinitomicaceae bacterium]